MISGSATGRSAYVGNNTGKTLAGTSWIIHNLEDEPIYDLACNGSHVVPERQFAYLCRESIGELRQAKVRRGPEASYP